MERVLEVVGALAFVLLLGMAASAAADAVNAAVSATIFGF